MPTSYYSHGKLLITGEYAVLDGALSLALPTKYGQSLEIGTQPIPDLLEWHSLDYSGEVWFRAQIRIDAIFGKLSASVSKASNTSTTNTLLSVLNAAIHLNPSFIHKLRGKRVITRLEFPSDWGLGSSSTFINNIAQWAGINAYELLWKGFVGSGYDIACAQSDTPITYEVADKTPKVTPVIFNPNFKNQLFFIHLNKKQNSREGIARYQQLEIDKKELKTKIDPITQAICQAESLAVFEKLIEKHEQIIGDTLKLTAVKELLFSDYSGAIKSLGAWGGDFILATGNKEFVFDYFQDKGFHTILAYSEIIL
ncbi:GYDIA family GHMP kinase [Ascidiimonas sp. W6]|uniref:GYDIA family GHMP kinase n=1 Tax=Ascidiimonas meishanensis TaxID=3128903 RepID=UPI0030ED66F9